MFKVNSKNTRTVSLTSFWCFHCELWKYFIPSSSVFVFDFEQVNVGWDLLWYVCKIILFVFFLNFKLSSLCKKCPYSEFFWSVFCYIRTEYRVWIISHNAEKDGQEILQILSLFTQSFLTSFIQIKLSYHLQSTLYLSIHASGKTTGDTFKDSISLEILCCVFKSKTLSSFLLLQQDAPNCGNNYNEITI